MVEFVRVASQLVKTRTIGVSKGGEISQKTITWLRASCKTIGPSSHTARWNRSPRTRGEAVRDAGDGIFATEGGKEVQRANRFSLRGGRRKPRISGCSAFTSCPIPVRKSTCRKSLSQKAYSTFPTDTVKLHPGIL